MKRAVLTALATAGAIAMAAAPAAAIDKVASIASEGPGPDAYDQVEVHQIGQGARALVKRAQTTKKESMLVNGAPAQSHLDPLVAAPKRNEFLKTVIGFLQENEEK